MAKRSSHSHETTTSLDGIPNVPIAGAGSELKEEKVEAAGFTHAFIYCLHRLLQILMEINGDYQVRDIFRCKLCSEERFLLVSFHSNFY